MKLKDEVRKKLILIAGLIVLIIAIILTVKLYSYLRVKYAKKEVKFYDLEVEVYAKVKVKDFIKSINGKIINNYEIDTTKLGKKEVEFTFINDDNIKIPYNFTINIVDKTPPLIEKKQIHTVYKGYDGDVSKDIFCGDNYDDTPKCKIIGDYNINEVGEYPVVFEAVDSNRNKSTHNFTIKVIEKTKGTYSNSKFTFPNDVINFSEIKKEYKNNKVGIDISKWQGEVDYKQLKKEKVDFVILRLGYQKEIEGELELDPTFTKHIKNLNKLNIPVGVYLYSKANSKEEAIKQAKWIKKEIKKYKVDLPVAFDWEDFASYQEYKVSFYHLTEIAKTFMNQIEKYGYSSILYSSKSKLLEVWYPTKHDVWLAHYTRYTDYKEKFKLWQLTEKGKISGIDENTVDIDIMY